MATQDLGNLGPGTGKSVLFRWQWYYSVPGLFLWIILLLLAIVPKQNRNVEAWLVLTLPLLVYGLFFMIQSGTPDLTSDLVAQFCRTLSIAWSSVWLLGPWLYRRDRARNALAALTTMFFIGAAGYVGYFGFWISSELIWPMFTFWAACSVSLVVATALTGYFCDGSCSPLRHLLWPALWIPTIAGTCFVIFFTGMAIFDVGIGLSGIEFLMMVVVQVIIVSVVAGIMLYLLNLPVVLLCIFSPCYRERFRIGYGRPSKEFERDRYREAASGDDQIDPTEALRKTM